MNMDSYECYVMFQALKNHFTTKSYDYIKYNGKIKISKDSFLANKDKYKYAKLARKYDDEKMRDFLLANFISGKKWIGEFLEEDASDIAQNYLKRKQSFTYTFTNEITKLIKDKDPHNLFKVKDNQYPEIVNAHIQGDISIESLAVLNRFINFFDKFDAKIGKDDIIWSKIKTMALKVEPFIQYDKEKIKAVLKELLL